MTTFFFTTVWASAVMATTLDDHDLLAAVIRVAPAGVAAAVTIAAHVAAAIAVLDDDLLLHDRLGFRRGGDAGERRGGEQQRDRGGRRKSKLFHVVPPGGDGARTAPHAINARHAAAFREIER